MNIGLAIREIRKEKGIKLKELAAKADISGTAIVNIEHGRSFPSMNTISKICDALGVSNAVLMLHCITEEDVPEDKRKGAIDLINVVKDYLLFAK